MSREAVGSKLKTLMGFEAAEAESAAQAEQAARARRMSIFTGLISGGASVAAAGMGG